MGFLILYYLIASAGPLFASTNGYLGACLRDRYEPYAPLGEDLSLAHLAGLVFTLLGAWMVNKQPVD